MKLFSLLISFILLIVNVSSLSTKTDYEEEVFRTNAHIKLAYDKNNFTINEKFVLNGLEHVIKTIVESRKHGLGRLNNMFAVPEFRPFYNDWDELIENQEAVQEVIQSELKISVPQVPDEVFGTLVLVDLGEKRREYTRTALKNILNRITSYRGIENATNLINQRGLRGKDEDLENRISRALAGPEQEISAPWVCYLIALFMSTKCPWSHIKSVQITSNDTCNISDSLISRYSTKQIYKKIEGQWHHITDNKAQLLKELL